MCSSDLLKSNDRGSSWESLSDTFHRSDIKGLAIQLKEFSLDTITDKNFIELLRVSRGVVQKKVSPTDYNLLEQTLARRTFDDRRSVGENHRRDGTRGRDRDDGDFVGRRRRGSADDAPRATQAGGRGKKN